MSVPWSSKGEKATSVDDDEFMIIDSEDAVLATTNKRLTKRTLLTNSSSLSFPNLSTLPKSNTPIFTRNIINSNEDITGNLTTSFHYRGLVWNPNGFAFYTANSPSREIVETAVTERFDMGNRTPVSTGILEDTGGTILSSSLNSLAFSSDGLFLFVVTSSKDIFQYEIGTAFDTSTINLQAIFTQDISEIFLDQPTGHSFTPNGIQIHPHSDRIYVGGDYNNGTTDAARVFEGNITPINISTLEYTANQFFEDDTRDLFNDFKISDDGAFLFAGDFNDFDNDIFIRQYPINSPWNITSANITGAFTVTVDNDAQDLFGFDIMAAGERFWITQENSLGTSFIQRKMGITAEGNSRFESDVRIDGDLTLIGDADVTGDFDVTGDSTVGSQIISAGRFQSLSSVTGATAATNLELPTDGNFIVITGSTEIETIDNTSWQNGSIIILKFLNTPNLSDTGTESGSEIPLHLAGGGDFLVSADTIVEFILDGDLWREVSRTVP